MVFMPPARSLCQEPAARFARSMPLTKAEIARIRDLREKKHREAGGLYVIEGVKVVAELLAAQAPVEALYVTPDWPGAREEASIHPITVSEMARLSHFPTPSPALALVRLERRELPGNALRDGRTLALDGVQDAGNVGTLLRIADWFGFDRVLVSRDCADLHSQKVINASMGSFLRVPAFSVDLASVLADAGAPILGCDLHGDDVHSLGPLASAVVVIGSEGRGLSPAVRACVTRFVTIPRFGRAESLNAAVAAAIVCDQLRRAGS
jgi:TrmH family RNA methyltransferase